jgi:alpha/beta superfamily hydrolase
MKTQSITFPCGSIQLHGYCYTPESQENFPAAIICHPHSLYGGSMDNYIVKRLATALADNNIVSMIFNFRGVGQSQGSFDNGTGEQDDITAAIDWLLQQTPVDKDRIGLAGYSFGGGVSIPVACRDLRIKALALISPVINEDAVKILRTCNKPKIFIIGEYDDVTTPATIEIACNNAAEPKLHKLIPEADHFWYGYENEAVNLAADFLTLELYKR